MQTVTHVFHLLLSFLTVKMWVSGMKRACFIPLQRDSNCYEVQFQPFSLVAHWSLNPVRSVYDAHLNGSVRHRAHCDRVWIRLRRNNPSSTIDKRLLEEEARRHAALCVYDGRDLVSFEVSHALNDDPYLS